MKSKPIKTLENFKRRLKIKKTVISIKHAKGIKGGLVRGSLA